MNHAFLIQVHQQPQLVRRMVKHLEAPNHYFFIHVDKKCRLYYEFEDALKDIPNILYTPSINVMHGGFSQIRCTLSQFEQAINGPVCFDYFHTLSGQDYPCATVAQFDTFFENAYGRSYMYMDTEAEIQAWRYTKYSDRMEYWNVADLLCSNWLMKHHVIGAVNGLLRIKKHPCTLMNRIWGGWNWFSLHRRVVTHLLDYLKEHSDYIKCFKMTCCGDELFYATILHEFADALNIETRNALRFVEWHPQRQHSGLPLILREEEYQQIIQSDCLFCRKVDGVESAQLLELIDSHLAHEHL